jgi:spore coat polysaccharide biosynthesis predicted glycosyltransferase SpsG
VIRADANKIIGTGHVMRTSVIAEELISRGQEVIFVGKFSKILWLKTRIEHLGFSRIIADEKKFISNPKTDILILDSYTLLVDNEFIQPMNWYSIVSIFDISTPDYASNLIIHPSIITGWKPKTKTNFLTGPNYIPLRNSITKSLNNDSSSDVLQILVVGGGTDSLNFVQAILKVLKVMPQNFNVSLFTDRISSEQLDSRFSVFSLGSHLDVKAKNCDLVFTTASTSGLEFIAREIPLGIGCAVDNQKYTYESLTNLKIAFPIGQYILDKWNLDAESIHQLIKNQHLRQTLKSRCKDLIDLKGTKRIADKILTL